MSVVVRGPARMLELARWLADDGAAPGGLPVLRAKNLFALPSDAVRAPPRPASILPLYTVQTAAGRLMSAVPAALTPQGPCLSRVGRQVPDGYRDLKLFVALVRQPGLGIIGEVSHPLFRPFASQFTCRSLTLIE